MVDSVSGRSLSTVELCGMLGLHRRQKNLCRRQGVAETLVRSTQLSAVECQHQFRLERWNCTLGTYRINMLQRGESPPDISLATCGLL